MNFSRQAADQRHRALGLSFVMLLHVLIAYALLTGLGKKVMELVKAPIETRVIEEVRKPEPPPEMPVPLPPKMDAPPPPFVPPPEVQVQVPVEAQATITATPVAPPSLEFRPTPVPAEPAHAAPVPMSASVVCSNHASVMGDVAYPREAQRAGIDKGEAVVQFVVAASGELKDARVVRSTHAVFARASLRIVSEYRCQGRGHDVLVEVPIAFQLL